MNSFFLFEEDKKKIFFHAEYCTVSAVHTQDGYVEKEKIITALGKTDILPYLTAHFSSNGFFEFLKEHSIPFVIQARSYSDTSSDV